MLTDFSLIDASAKHGKGYGYGIVLVPADETLKIVNFQPSFMLTD